MKTYLISDIHLSQSDSALCERFFGFIKGLDPDQTNALYILGDFFEVWIGDDEPSALHTRVAKALKQLSQQGIPIYIMHGNRDFLMGKTFVKSCGASLLPDPSLINIANTPIVISHGDELCSDDKAYQRFRKLARHRLLQRFFLALPLKWRQKIGRDLRQYSGKQDKPLAIMDVNSAAAKALCQSFNSTFLIHGHTHRPATHTENNITRIVLSDWHTQGHALVINEKLNIENLYF